jgi:hypothetical protein
MNPTRMRKRQDWEQKYVSLVSGIGNDSLAKVRAHLKNIDEYWLRWLGLCRIEIIFPQSFVDNALLIVIEAASSVADLDISSVAGKRGFAQCWREYLDALAVLHNRPPRAIGLESEELYLRFKECVRLFEGDH